MNHNVLTITCEQLYYSSDNHDHYYVARYIKLLKPQPFKFSSSFVLGQLYTQLVSSQLQLTQLVSRNAKVLATTPREIAALKVSDYLPYTQQITMCVDRSLLAMQISTQLCLQVQLCSQLLACLLISYSQLIMH